MSEPADKFYTLFGIEHPFKTTRSGNWCLLSVSVPGGTEFKMHMPWFSR